MSLHTGRSCMAMCPFKIRVLQRGLALTERMTGNRLSRSSGSSIPISYCVWFVLRQPPAQGCDFFTLLGHYLAHLLELLGLAHPFVRLAGHFTSLPGLQLCQPQVIG